MGTHINTFENGMTSDVNVVYQPDGSYLYMKNCTLISQEGGNFAVKDCLGNALVFTINTPYNGTIASNAAFSTAIAMISFPDKLVVYSTNSLSGGYGEIGLVKYLPYGEGVKPLSTAGEKNAGYVPLYHHIDLNFAKEHKIEGFAFPESDNIERVYWTDFNEEPRVMNIADPIFTTYFETGDLVVGTQYMVLEGAVTHNAVNYGPGITAGNIFTAVNANFTDLTDPSPTAKVIEYYDYNLLSWTPDWSVGETKFKEYGDGGVLCGNKLFFHRLITEDGTYTTPWSFGSYPVEVLDKTGAADPSGAYFDLHGAGTSTTTVNSSRSVVITINGIDQRYKYIEVCVAEFDQLIDTPRQVVKFAKKEITDDEMEFEYNGTNIGSVAIADITTFAITIEKCKSITTNKNYNIVAHIQERAELTLDLSDAVLSSFEYPLFLSNDISPCTVSQNKNVATTGINPGAGEIYPHTKWKVVSGGVATYNGNNYAVDSVFIGVAGGGNWGTFSGAPQIRPCVSLNRYMDGADRVENPVLLAEGHWDYTDPVVQNNLTGNWSGETYRYAFEAIDLKGKPFYSIPFPEDFTFPSLNDKGGVMLKESSGGTDYYSLNPSGLKIDNLFIPDTVLDQMQGFRIVRAVRSNPRIVAQGLVTQVTSSGTVLYPAGYNPPGYSFFPLSSNTYVYLSPDLNCDVTLKTEIGSVGKTMEEACWLGAYLNDGGTNPNKFVTNADFVVCRLVEPIAADDFSPRSSTLTHWQSVTDGETVTLPNGVPYSNITEIIAAAGPTPSVTCIGGGPYSIDGYIGKGGKSTIFGLDEDFFHWGPAAYLYTEDLGAGGWIGAQDDYKILMNYVNPGGGTYGNLEDTLYISTGHYQPINSTVRAATAATVGGVPGSLFDGIEVMGGDCFTCYTDYGYTLWDNTSAGTTYSQAWYFPCECNANYNLRKGRKVSQDGMYYTGATTGNKIVWISADTKTQLEGFEYNNGYSSEGQSFLYPGQPLTFNPTAEQKNMIRYAGQKIIGETDDVFRIFNALDYTILDAQGGPINKVASKDGRVFVWQPNQTVTVPVLERQLLSGLQGAATTLGTGGVLDRFDPITSFFGSQHQHGIIETEFGFVWFDMRRKAFMAMSTSGGIVEISQKLRMKDFFDRAFVEAIGDNYDSMEGLIDAPDFNITCDQPLVGVGITGVYDPKFKMTYLTFKFKRRTDSLAFTNADFTIGYYHPKDKFIHFWDWTPALAHVHNKMLLSVNNPKNIDRFYGAGMTNAAFSLGEVINGGNNAEYITTAASPAIGYTSPPSATYFTKINSTDQIWVHYQPSALDAATAPANIYNSIFGRILSNILTFVINPQTKNPFTVMSMQQKGNNVKVTDVLVETDNDSATDASIRDTDRNYEVVWDGINSNLPLGDRGRLVGSYHKVTLTKKNWTTNPTVLVRSVKILRKVISFFVEKR